MPQTSALNEGYSALPTWSRGRSIAGPEAIGNEKDEGTGMDGCELADHSKPKIKNDK